MSASPRPGWPWQHADQAGLMFLAHVADQHHDSVSVRAEDLTVDEQHHRQTEVTLRPQAGSPL